MLKSCLCALAMVAGLAWSQSVPVAVPSRLQDRFSLTDYGAVGDGMTDNTTAIQNALTGSCTRKAAIYVPAGTYNYSATLTTGCATEIYGDGPWSSIFVKTNPTANKNGLVSQYSLTVRDIGFNQTSLSSLIFSGGLVRCDNTGSDCMASPASGAGQKYVFERVWSSGFNYGINVAGWGAGTGPVDSVTVKDCFFTVVGTRDAIAEPVNIRTAGFADVEGNTLTGSGENDHEIYMIDVQDVRVANNVISHNHANDSAVKLIGGDATATLGDWVVEGNTITSMGQAMTIFEYGSNAQPSVHVLHNLIVGSTDTYAPDGGTINFYAQASRSEFVNIEVGGNVVQNSNLGVVTLNGPGIFAYTSIHNNTFQNWSTTSPGTHYAIATNGNPTCTHLSVSGLVADGSTHGRAALNVNCTTLEVSDIHELNVTNPTLRFPQFTIQAPDATSVPLRVAASSAQTADLVDIVNSSGTVLLSINSAGILTGTVYGPAVPGVYNASGVRDNPTHITYGGSATMTGGTVTVTFTGAAVFTNASTYFCTASDTSAANAVRVVQTSGSSVTFDGTGTDTVQYVCAGH